MTFETGLVFFISMLLMWIKPGPAQLLKISTTLEKGLLCGISFSLGSGAMCSIFFVVVALGYKALSDIFSYTGFFLQILGAAYLVFLSIKGFIKFYQNQKNIILNDTDEIALKTSSIFTCFTFGFLATLTSPFWIFYFIGILPALIPLSDATVHSFFLGAFLVFLSGAMVDWPLLTLVKQLQNEFAAGKLAKYVSLFINFSFLGVAVFLLYSAFFVQEFEFTLTDAF